MNHFKTFYFALLTFLSLSVSNPIIAADHSPSNTLIIGRPEQGGADFDRAQYPVTGLKVGSVWYLDPRSKGCTSIAEFFPCSIPSNVPQQFEIVIVEKGMLNEVVATVKNSSPVAAETPVVVKEPKSSCLSDEYECTIKVLKTERQSCWQKWTDLKQKLEDLNQKIIGEALDLKLLEESIEHGHVFYRIVGKNTKDTYSSATVVDFLIKERINIPHVLEFQTLLSETDEAHKEMLAFDKATDILYKRAHKQECQTAEQNLSLPTMPTATNSVSPHVVFDHINNLIDRAWDLVSPGGSLIVFVGDAKIAETLLVNGISSSFLSSKSNKIEEFFFDSQAFEGERYYSNPVLPAQYNIVGWSGGREAGSYLVIHKALTAH